eukprot:INCI13901.1.p1 GENE.INCI13901.1~~INCI13901.1.p1  ORF type:complete len:173 (-),score=31.61 INCI13901.1:76-594(-)
MLLKLCVLESQETSSRASELLSPFSSKLKKTKLSTDGAAAANQQERNLVTASVRTIFALSTLQDPPHPLTEHSEFKQLVRVTNLCPPADHAAQLCSPCPPDPSFLCCTLRAADDHPAETSLAGNLGRCSPVSSEGARNVSTNKMFVQQKHLSAEENVVKMQQLLDKNDGLCC